MTFGLVKFWNFSFLGRESPSGNPSLFQPERVDYPHLLLPAPPIFFTFRQTFYFSEL